MTLSNHRSGATMEASNFEDSLVLRSASVRDVIENLNRSSPKIALVVDEKRRLLGTVTDGDIRRAILRGVSLDMSVEDVVRKNFQSLPETATAHEARQYMRSRKVDHVPLVDLSGIVKGLEQLGGTEFAAIKPNTVVIMAGGLGTRLSPLTDHTPKPMIAVGGKPMLERIISSAAEDGFENFILAVNYLGEQIEDHFGDGKDFGVAISYLKEDEPLGTAGALSLLPLQSSESVVVLNGDVLMQARLSEMLHFHTAGRGLLTMAVKVLETQVPFGVVSVAGSYVQHIAEKPTYRDYINAGIYVIEPQVLRTIPRGIRLDMPDLISQVLGDQKVLAFPLHESWIDLGRRSDLDRAESEFSRTSPGAPGGVPGDA